MQLLGMRTTIALDAAVRDRLLELKRAWRARSIEEVLVRLVGNEPRGALALYAGNRRAVATVMRQRRLANLVAFGSRVRGDARPDSDLDLCADLPPDADLLDVAHIQDDLSRAFGVKVHFTPRQGLGSRMQSRIAAEGVVLHG